MSSRFGDLVIFPSNGSVTRHSPFPPRGPAGPVPPLHRYYQGAKTPWSLPPRFVSFAWQYRGCARRFAPTGCGRPLLWAWTFWSPGVQPEFLHGDHRVLPGSWADPNVCMPWAGTPEDPRRQASTAPRMLPSAHPTALAPRTSCLSRLVYHGLHTRCLRFAAWVTPLHHARLASGGWPTLTG